MSWLLPDDEGDYRVLGGHGYPGLERSGAPLSRLQPHLVPLKALHDGGIAHGKRLLLPVV